MYRVDAVFLDAYVFLGVRLGEKGGEQRRSLWLLDTGASFCVIDQRALPSVNAVKTRDRVDMRSSTSTSLPVARMPALHVYGKLVKACSTKGRESRAACATLIPREDVEMAESDDDGEGVRSVNVTAVVQDLDGLWRTVLNGDHDRLRPHVAGVLGYTWLRDYVLRIDWRRKTVWAARRRTAPPLQESPAALVPLRTRLNAQQMVLLDARLDDLPAIGDACQKQKASDASWWIVDTGADASLMSATAVRQWRLPERVAGDRAVQFTLADADDIRLTMRQFRRLALVDADDARVAAAEVRAPVVLMDRTDAIGALQCAAVGTLGNELWRRIGVVWLDYRRADRIVWLEPP